MAHIILPHRWQQQPQYPVEVDWGNPLTLELVEVWNGATQLAYHTYGVTSKVANASLATPFGVAGFSTTTFSAPSGVERYHPPMTVYTRTFKKALQGSGSVHIAGFVGTGDDFYIRDTPYQFQTYLQRNYAGPTIIMSAFAPVAGRLYDCFARSNSNTSHEMLVWSNTGQYGSGTSTTDTSAVSYVDSTPARMGDGTYNAPLIFAIWNRALSDAEISEVRRNPWQLFRPLQRRIWVPVSAGGPTYTLTAAAGSFSLTGNAAGLTAARQIAAASGSYALTGNAAGLTAARTLTADSGSFTLTGNSANLTAARLLTAANGSFVLTGNDATLTYTPNVTYTLTAAAGSFTLTGNAANLTAARLLTAENGIFTLTGHDAALVGPGDEVATAPVGGGIGHGGKQRKRKVYIERDGKLQVFIDSDHADAFLNATKAIKEARKLPKAKQIKKAIKAAEKAISEAKPALVLPLEAIPALAPNLHQAKTAEKLIQQAQWARIVAMYEKWIDEDDEDILLLAA